MVFVSVHASWSSQTFCKSLLKRKARVRTDIQKQWTSSDRQRLSCWRLETHNQYNYSPHRNSTQSSLNHSLDIINRYHWPSWVSSIVVYLIISLLLLYLIFIDSLSQKCPQSFSTILLNKNKLRTLIWNGYIFVNNDFSDISKASC